MGPEGIQSIDNIEFLRRRITIKCEAGTFSREDMALVDDWILKHYQILVDKPNRTVRDTVISEIELAQVYIEIKEHDLARSTLEDLFYGPLSVAGFEDLEDEIQSMLDSLPELPL